MNMAQKNARPKNRINKQREIEKRKRKNNKNKLIAILIIIILACIGTYLFTSPTFTINKIVVNGNSQLSKEKVIEMSELKIGDNIFKQIGIVTKVKLKQHGYIEDATISKKYPDTVEINVTERKRQYQIKTESETYIYIDEQGYLLEKSNEKIDVPTIIGMEITENDVEKQKRLDENDLDKMENVLQIKEQCKRIGIADKITEIQVKNEYILILGNEHITINLGDATNLKSRIDYVAALLKQEAGNAGTIYVNGNLNGGFLPYFSAN